MSEQLARISSWARHLVQARTRHGVHSPFIFDLVEQVLRPTAPVPGGEAIEKLRDDLFESEQVIRVNDLGAGSRVLDLPIRPVRDIARTSLKPAKQARMLYRLAQWCDPATIVELGTSFGLTTLYLARGAEEARVITVEGCPQIHRIARHHFELLRQTNIEAVLGSFNNTLPQLLKTLERVDMAFIDGHHAEEPTVELFTRLAERAHNNSVFVLDDIHWSTGMERAWERVKQHERVTVTVDLYDLGLVFFRQEQAPQHFRLRY